MEPQPAFLEGVPAVARPTRQEMIAVADRYFTAIDGGRAPFGPDCNRVQNGTQTTNNPSFSKLLRPRRSPKTSPSSTTTTIPVPP